MASRLTGVPPLRQRLFPAPLDLVRPGWVDSQVDIREHVFKHVCTGGTLSDAASYAAGLATTPSYWAKTCDPRCRSGGARHTEVTPARPWGAVKSRLPRSAGVALRQRRPAVDKHAFRGHRADLGAPSRSQPLKGGSIRHKPPGPTGITPIRYHPVPNCRDDSFGERPTARSTLSSPTDISDRSEGRQRLPNRASDASTARSPDTRGGRLSRAC